MANTTWYCLTSFPPKTEKYFMEVDVPSKTQMLENPERFPEIVFLSKEIQFNTGILANIKNTCKAEFNTLGCVTVTWELIGEEKMIFIIQNCNIEFYSKKQLLSSTNLLNEEVVMKNFADTFAENCDEIHKIIWTSTGNTGDDFGQIWNDEVDHIRLCFLIQLQEPSKVVPVANTLVHELEDLTLH